MNKNFKLFLFISMILLINIALAMIIKSENIFWGKEYINKNNQATKELTDKITENLKIKITAPASGAYISRTVTVEGIAGKENNKY